VAEMRSSRAQDAKARDARVRRRSVEENMIAVYIKVPLLLTLEDRKGRNRSSFRKPNLNPSRSLPSLICPSAMFHPEGRGNLEANISIFNLINPTSLVLFILNRLIAITMHVYINASSCGVSSPEKRYCRPAGDVPAT
jgi:hypothetical protein